MIVFRLEQLTGERGQDPPDRLDRLGSDAVKEVPIEQALTESMLIEGDREPHEAERGARGWCVRSPNTGTARARRVPSPVSSGWRGRTALLRPVRQDDGDAVREQGHSHAERDPLAIGQLADYGRLVTPDPELIVLVPEAPRPYLRKLAESQGLSVVWPGEGGVPDAGA